MKIDILAFGAHPDDVELGTGGTLAKHAAMGYKTGIIDLTRGELGTRGTPETRDKEAMDAAKILNLSVRENLEMRDGFILDDEEHQLKVIKALRKYRPNIVLCNAPNDRHPDHPAASKLLVSAAFKAGLRKIETTENGQPQEPWRPKALYHYIQFYDLEPTFAVDISDFIEQKMKAVEAYASQFYNPNSDEPKTLIAQKNFMEMLRSRSQNYGIHIGTEYAEGFIVERYPGIDDLTHLK